MQDFETLVAELLNSRPELTREELNRRIEDKKKTVGAGYLTDQGALFLVAGELGVSLQAAPVSDLTIRDLYIGANDVTAVGRVLAMYPTSTYQRKKDGGSGKYRRLVLFDGKQSVRLTIWEEQVDAVDKLGLEVDIPVRVVSGYVKQGLDGKANLNLGKKGRIELIRDEKVSAKVVPLLGATEGLSTLNQEKPFVAVSCVVNSEPRYSEFVRADGSPGSLFQFTAVGLKGKDETRVVVWSPSQKPELKPGQQIVVTNVRSRKTATGEFELHGDAGSVILLGQKKEPIELRVASVIDAFPKKIVLAVDKEKRVRILEVGKGVIVPITRDVVLVNADEDSGGRLVCNSPGSIEITKNTSIMELEGLATKIRDMKEEGVPLMVEVIALSQGTVDDVNLRDGSTAKKGEVLVGDDTGEIRAVAWRNLSTKLEGVQPGERLRVMGATWKPNKLGAATLQITDSTTLEKLHGSD